MGIAICHFELAAKECGIDVSIEVSDPGLPVPGGEQYIATCII